MAPKSKSGVKPEDLKQEDTIQAVVFADSFNTNFAPISEDKPRVLFPVANSALLEYTLEFLSSGGVEEVFVFCCHHADQVKEHLRNSRWNEKSSPCKVVPIVSEGCLSMGDALRDIEGKNLIRSDFILIYGDVVSNIKLQPIIQEHKQRREKDKTTVMTLVLRQVPPGHVTRTFEDDIVLAVDNQTQNVIHYKKVSKMEKQSRFEFPMEVLLEHNDVQVRYDLLDSNISVCSPQVTELFKDNFDYETRDSFVRGVLINEEIMGNTLKMHVVTDAYAARISNLQMYDAVSQDILNRWTFPFVPDNCYRHNRDLISYGRQNIYLSKNVTLERDCKLEENVLLGSGTCVGNNTAISHSVIGRNCTIGKNVTIRGTYLWDNVTVEDDCTVDSAILCENVCVYKKVKICPGCILASNVCIGPDVEMTTGLVLVSSLVDDFGDGDLDAPDGGSTDLVYGAKGKAFAYTDQDGDDSDQEELVRPMWGLNIASDVSEDESDTDRSEDNESLPDSLHTDVPDYYVELLDTVKRAKVENINNENLILEINSLKHAYNVSIKELTVMVVRALLEQPLAESPSLVGPEAVKLIKKVLSTRLPVLQNYIKNQESQTHCMKAIEEFGCCNSSHMPLVTKVIHGLYEYDVLEETVILRWHRELGDQGDDVEDEETAEKLTEIRKQVAPLIKWLEEAEEESSDED